MGPYSKLAYAQHHKDFFFWTDSNIALNWLKSESCWFKVFVGTSVSEIQELTRDHE